MARNQFQYFQQGAFPSAPCFEIGLDEANRNAMQPDHQESTTNSTKRRVFFKMIESREQVIERRIRQSFNPIFAYVFGVAIMICGMLGFFCAFATMVRFDDTVYREPKTDHWPCLFFVASIAEYTLALIASISIFMLKNGKSYGLYKATMAINSVGILIAIMCLYYATILENELLIANTLHVLLLLHVLFVAILRIKVVDNQPFNNGSLYRKVADSSRLREGIRESIVVSTV